jgi:Rha family phage regulatory protein
MRYVTVANKESIDSREVAKMVKKGHAHLCSDIKGYIDVISENPKLDSQDYFIPNTYKVEGNNKTYPCYDITKLGCEMIANKLTGKKGIMFTAEYVKRFNEMEEGKITPDLPDFTNPVIAARAWADAMEKKQLAESQVKELAPKAEFYDTVADSESLMSMADTCKILDMGIGRNKLFALLREKGILQKDNMPYQRFVDAGYFKVVEGKYEANENVVISKTTYVKQKGIDYISKLLSRREGIANAETD